MKCMGEVYGVRGKHKRLERRAKGLQEDRFGAMGEGEEIHKCELRGKAGSRERRELCLFLVVPERLGRCGDLLGTAGSRGKRQRWYQNGRTEDDA